uniref:Uncharacterized protein n=1 Tax=Amazona collaria TaxID=241587 RepID=A0A8B9IXF1_9PSIT
PKPVLEKKSLLVDGAYWLYCSHPRPPLCKEKLPPRNTCRELNHKTMSLCTLSIFQGLGMLKRHGSTPQSCFHRCPSGNSPKTKDTAKGAGREKCPTEQERSVKPLIWAAVCHRITGWLSWKGALESSGPAPYSSRAT